MSVQSEINRIISAVADAYDEVDTKGGTLPQTQNVGNLANAIASIPSGGTDVSDTTATASEVMSGYYFYVANGTKTEGTIADQTGFSGSITTKNGDITIPQGYHDGESSIGIATSEKNKIIAGNIKSGVTILGVAGSLSGGTDVSDTTAVASDVLETKDFYLANGTKTTGTMADQSGTQKLGTTFASTNYMGLYINSPGYYDTTSRVVMARTNFGDAAASNVVSGKTFTSSEGWVVEGTMTDHSDTAQAAGSLDATTSNIRMFIPSAGYYDTNARIYKSKASFGNASVSDVAKGKTFTSSAGLLATGTGVIGALLATQSLGSQSTTSTSAVEISQKVSVADVSSYDLLIVDTSVDTVVTNRHTSTTSVIMLAATSNISTKTGASIATLKHNTKISSSSVTSSRTNTTAYGIYPTDCSIANNAATITMSKKYNSTYTGTLNGTYTTRVYGVNLLDLIGG